MSVRLPAIKHTSLSLTSKVIFKPVTALQSLKAGDIIAGKIVDLFSQNAYVVRLGGQEVVVQSHIALTPKQEYSLQVLSTAPELLLKVKDSLHELSHKQQVSQILKAFHLPASALTRQIVTQMLSLGIPISNNNIIVSSEIIKQMFKRKGSGKISDSEIRAIVILKRYNISLSGASIAIARKLFENGFPLFNDKEFKIEWNVLSKSTVELPILLQEFVNANTLSEKAVTTAKLSSVIDVLTANDDDVGLSQFVSTIVQSKNLIGNGLYFHVFLAAIKILGGYRLSHIVSEEIKNIDSPFYFPLMLCLDSHNMNVEFFYRTMTFYPENFEKTPGFQLNILIYIENSSPLHIVVTKKAQQMISIKFHHPHENNINLLELNQGLLKQILVRHGYSTVNISYHITDTSDPLYRAGLFMHKMTITKSVNITG